MLTRPATAFLRVQNVPTGNLNCKNRYDFHSLTQSNIIVIIGHSIAHYNQQIDWPRPEDFDYSRPDVLSFKRVLKLDGCTMSHDLSQELLVRCDAAAG